MQNSPQQPLFAAARTCLRAAADRATADLPAKPASTSKASRRVVLQTALALALGFAATTAGAHEDTATTGAIHAKANQAVRTDFDLVQARIRTEKNIAIFQMTVSGKAGQSRPTPVGKLAGSDVFSYVWPTTIDPYEAGFERASGILAMAVTAHPDFDDTPLFDENGDGKADNDGNLWHSHWVVLKKNPACGADALAVVDIPAGTRPRLPKTWPGLPILIDSPGWQPSLQASTVEVRVPFDDIGVVGAAGFDGVTAGLRVNASVHAPLLCVVDVFKVASGNLSLPGKPER